MDVRILIVADDPLTRAGLAALLGNEPGCIVAGQTASGPPTAGRRDDRPPQAADQSRQVLAAALDAHRPDVLVWDLGWDPQEAVERLASLPGDHPPVVALVPGPELANRVWSAGVRSLLLREADGRQLAAAARAATHNLVVLDPSLSAGISARGRSGDYGAWEGETLPPGEELTARELEVLRLVAEGLANKAIAQRLSISEHTVKFHVNAILGKLGVQSRTEAVVRATRLGLILL